MFNENIEAIEDDFDTDEALKDIVEPITKRGDIWKLGRHRLMCGDSIFIDDVEKLMNGKIATMVFTDPPYGIGYKAMRGGKDIANDASPNEALEVTIKALQIVSNTKTFFACCDWRSLEKARHCGQPFVAWRAHRQRVGVCRFGHHCPCLSG
jgi:hypothetical protein